MKSISNFNLLIFGIITKAVKYISNFENFMLDESEPFASPGRSEGFCSRKLLAIIAGIEAIVLVICVVLLAVCISYWTIEHNSNSTCDTTSTSPSPTISSTNQPSL